MPPYESVTTDPDVFPVHAQATADPSRAPSPAELSESLSLLRATLDATRDALLALDEHGRLTLVNQRFAELWQVQVDLHAPDAVAVLRERLLAQVTDPDTLRADLDRLRGDPQAVHAGRMAMHDGRVIAWHSQPSMRNGRPAGRLYSFLDVTEQTNADIALQ